MSKSSVARPCARLSGLFSSRLASAALIILLAVPAMANATQFEVSRLASELNQVSSELAAELKNSRGYGSVRFSADRLSRAAADLVSAIRRNRSGSFLRSEFQDVARHYRELEEAFLRSGREHNRYVYSQVGLISNLFSGLNSEFYYTHYVEPAPQVFYYSPPVITRHRLPPAYSGRSVNPARPAGDRDVGNRRGSDRVTVVVPHRYSHRSAVEDRHIRRLYESEQLDRLGARHSSGSGGVSGGRDQSRGIRYPLP
jgi:hypothetical protein